MSLSHDTESTTFINYKGMEMNWKEEKSLSYGGTGKYETCLLNVLNALPLQDENIKLNLCFESGNVCSLVLPRQNVKIIFDKMTEFQQEE